MIQKGKYEQIGQKLFRMNKDIYGLYRSGASATEAQISCLMGLILDYKFEDGSSVCRVAETGVNTGLTDYYLLKAGIESGHDFKMFGIDVATGHWVGEVVKQKSSDEEKACWVDCEGKTVFDIDDLLHEQEKLDLVFIDGAHAHPYPMLDLLFFLPYLRKDGLIVLHDVDTYIQYGELGGCYLFSGWRGEKYLNWTLDGKQTEYMGIVELPEDREIVHEWILRVVEQPISTPSFFYTSSEQRRNGDFLGIGKDSFERIKLFLEKHYDSSFRHEFLIRFKRRLEQYREYEIYNYHEQRLNEYYRLEIERLWDIISYMGLSKNYSFPDNLIKDTDEDVVIYGAGRVGRVYLWQLTHMRVQVNMVIDKKAKEIRESIFDRIFDVPVITPEEAVGKIEDKKVIIAVESKSVAEGIKKNLMDLGINGGHIIWQSPLIK